LASGLKTRDSARRAAIIFLRAMRSDASVYLDVGAGGGGPGAGGWESGVADLGPVVCMNR
jgi:hypothetical protein